MTRKMDQCETFALVTLVLSCPCDDRTVLLGRRFLPDFFVWSRHFVRSCTQCEAHFCTKTFLENVYVSSFFLIGIC